jgi:hypothetical protein
MSIRRFKLQDIPLLYKYRYQGIFLDSTRALIHGPDIVPMGAFLTFLGPSTRIYTYRYDNNSSPGKPIIGQLTYTPGISYARLSFLAPELVMELADLTTIADFMAIQVGSEGAFHILADVDESSPVYQLLRRAGFAIYARQRIWRLDGRAAGEAEAVNWRALKSVDLIRVKSLYCDVVPGLVQQVEPLPKKNLKGFVQYQNGDLSAYLELKYGRYGIWVQPYVHPNAERFNQKLVQFLHFLPQRHNRPLYFCVRSYQSWLESTLEALGAVPGPQQAVMVRHLTNTRRAKQPHPIPALNGTHAEPTAPIVRIEETQRMDLSNVKKNT